MSELFSGKGSVNIPPNEKFGRKKGKYGRMAGAIIQALGGLSSTPGLARERRKDPNATGVIYNRERGSKGAEAVNYSPRTKEKDEMERIMKEKAEKKGGRMFSDTTAFSINEGGLLGSKLVKPIGSEGNFIPPGISNRPINRKLLKRLGPDGGGMMIGGTSPIPGVSGHEYLNNPEYAEHRKDYYGKGKGRRRRTRRRAEKDRIREGGKPRGRRVREKKDLSEFDFTPKRPKFGTELIPPNNYDGGVGRPPVPMSKEDYDQINRRKRTGNMQDTNHRIRMF